MLSVCLPVQAKQKKMTVKEKNGCQVLQNRLDKNDYTVNCDFGVVDVKIYKTIHLDGEKGNFDEDSIELISSNCNSCFSGDTMSQSQKTININRSKVKEQCLNKECNVNINFKSDFITKKDHYTYHVVFKITYIDEITNETTDSAPLNKAATQSNSKTPSEPVEKHGGSGGTFDTINCEGIFSRDLIDFFVDILGYVKVFVPILIVLLGSIDLLRNVFAGNDDEIKKGWNRLVKRIVFGALIYVLIYFVSILFPFANEALGGCLSEFK
jgi:hypothetical protein